MSTTTYFLIRFYLPMLAASFLLLLMFLTPKIKPGSGTAEFEVKISVLSFFKIPLGVWIKNVWIVRAVVVMVSIILVVTSLETDFSQFFPARLKMDVYFDMSGMTLIRFRGRFNYAV